MTVLLNVKYFDEGTEKWVFRRPSVPSNALSNRSFSCTSINLGASSLLNPAQRASQLGSVVTPTAATFVVLLEVTVPVYEALLSEAWVRSYYGIIEQCPSVGTTLAQGPEGARPVDIEHSAVILIRRGVNVDFAESMSKEFPTAQGPQPLVAVNLRSFIGAGFLLLAAFHVSPTTTAEQRMSYINKVMERVSDNENCLLVGNFYHHNQPGSSDDFRVAMSWAKQRNDFPDVAESLPSAQRQQLESSIWWRSRNRKLEIEDVQMLAASNVYMSGIYTKFVSVTREVPSPPPATVPPLGSGTHSMQQFVDPAVVSVQRNQSGGSLPPPRSLAAAQSASLSDSSGVNIVSLLAKTKSRSERWSVASMIALKAPRQTLTSEELQYDITKLFASVVEAVEKLNSGSCQWSSDYAIVHSTLLSAAGVPCDLSSFKQYVITHPPPRSPLGVVASPKVETPIPIGRRLLPAGSPDSPLPGIPTPGTPQVTTAQPPLNIPPMRVRAWNENHVALLYQVTPKEMLFDITSDMGHARGNLRSAVGRLNAANGGRRLPDAKADRLSEWRYDYAILYCAERGAYWLLAAVDVPCDVHACRYAVNQLLSSTQSAVAAGATTPSIGGTPQPIAA